MKIKITKQGKILLLVILGILILGGGGYLLWRVNQPDTVAPTDSDAGGYVPGGGCCLAIEHNGNWICPYGEGATACDDNPPGSDSVCCGRTKMITCGGMHYCVTETQTCEDCDYDVVDRDCNVGSDCSNKCYWPEVAYCRNDGVCICKSGDDNMCDDTSPQCTPTCPSGYKPCTGSECGSDTVTAECSARCEGCDNLYYNKITCTKETVITPICGDGILGNTPGEQCELGDPNGVSCTWNTCNQTTCTCPDTPDPICGDGILGNTPGEQCELNDPNGVSCTWDSCNQTTCTCPEIPDPNPDWDITKVGAETCIEEGEEVMGQVVYTITVTNTGEGAGELTRLEDDLDSKVISTNILDITTGGTYSSGVITWNLNQTLQPEEQLTFTYTVKIPSTQFGTYTNTATAYPEEGDDISATFEVDVTCEIEDVPQTGLFDSVVSRIVFGVILILVGLNYRKLNYAVNEYTSDRRIKRFENRVANKK